MRRRAGLRRDGASHETRLALVPIGTVPAQLLALALTGLVPRPSVRSVHRPMHPADEARR